MDYPDQLGLWPHQSQAVDMVATYLNRQVRGPRGSGPASLVNVPTGGGKTAIIATVAHWHRRMRRVLVLAPRTAIRKQLAVELAAKRGFLQRKGYAPETLPKTVIHLRSSADIPEVLPEGIYVATIQLIDDLKRVPGQALFNRLADACDAVFVDEGHYEPAASWSETIRDIGRPLILVTATPYRNDLKTFQLEQRSIHVSRYAELAERRFLRRVEVVDIDPDTQNDPDRFVRAVLDAFEDAYGQPPSADKKLIIRCRTEEDIIHIGEAVRQALGSRDAAVGLHENFKADPVRPFERRQPEDPEAADAAPVWIHQHKLLEGVDGPSFRAVAFYGVLGSDRALVQQIGRVVRNPAREADQVALLIDHTGGYIRNSWENYLAYDELLTPGGVLQGINEIVALLEEEAPPVYYVEKKFRRRFRISHPAEYELRRSLRLPLRCHIVRAGARTNMVDLLRSFEKRFKAEGWLFNIITRTEEELILLYVTVAASPLLRDHYFMQRTLQTVIARRQGGYLVFLDTGRPNMGEALQLTAGPLPREALARALSQSEELRVVAVNAQNAALGPSAVRGRSLTAATLEETPPLLDEFQFVASTVKMAGRPAFIERAPDDDPRPDQFSVREVGFRRGRVSDGGARRRLAGWTAWTQALVEAIADPAQSTPDYLGRYAKPLAAPPPASAAESLLIDMDELAEEWVVAPNALGAAQGDPLVIADALVSCIAPANGPANQRDFVLNANGVQVQGNVTFDPAQECYTLHAPNLNRLYRREGAHSLGGIVDDLNQRQGFIILPETPGVIYAGGAFYDPDLGLGPGFDPARLGLDRLLVDRPALRQCATEKGVGQDPAGWAPGSVFHWIDTNRDEILPNADLVLCDDGNRESCDFLMVGRRAGRDVVVLVHAKASSTGGWVSASALYDVCGQAVKQVGTLSPFSPQKPHQVGLWGGSWSDPSGRAADVTHRVRVARGEFAGLSPNEIWARIVEKLGRHDCEREVALVLGASLSPEHLFDEASRMPTPGSAVHVVHQLRSTLAGVVGGGARLRVICG
ncbi:MAG: DEAD/DEAH box helicase family protein [Proteobacteria bacterium]|nr:DEAD/DEAH box helicase family protein [Pseudomonadota bacterium]